MNLFNCRNFKVLVDYAHNPHGYGAIEEYLKGVTAARKIGIISGVGDRRDQDIRECGSIAGRMFDHVIVRQERDLRNSSAERINALLLDGMRESGTAPSCEFIDDEAAAVSHALQMAGENDFVVALTDDIDAVVETIEKYKCDLAKYPVTNKLPESA
jgi:cyanophycin synthetase